jgi:hypothetical protein
LVQQAAACSDSATAQLVNPQVQRLTGLPSADDSILLVDELTTEGDGRYATTLHPEPASPFMDSSLSFAVSSEDSASGGDPERRNGAEKAAE